MAAKEAAGQAVGATRFFGYPGVSLPGVRTLGDVAEFLGLSVRTTRDLMNGAGAPRPLRLLSDRCHRWNPHQVVAWVHGVPTHEQPSVASADADRPIERDGRLVGCPVRIEWEGRGPGSYCVRTPTISRRHAGRGTDGC